jgi:hypothetical protein
MDFAEAILATLMTCFTVMVICLMIMMGVATFSILTGDMKVCESQGSIVITDQVSK